MNNTCRTLLLIILTCFLTGCAKNSKQDEADGNVAIRRAIEEHLAGRTGLANDQMVMDLKQVQIQGDKAEADVVFRTRSEPPQTMAFHYQLHSDGQKWKVENGHPSGDASPHPSPPPSGEAPALPEGHPPVQQ